MNPLKTQALWIPLGVLFLVLTSVSGQEEEKTVPQEDSAELFLEDYSDAFQESFFEALKQKGIENHDKAINLLLECKQIDPANKVVDHELAKAYLEERNYPAAQDFAIGTVIAEPGNAWYLETLVNIVQQQGNTLESLTGAIPYQDNQLKENLARIYLRQKNYERALKVLKDSKQTDIVKALVAKINDSVQKADDFKNITSQAAEERVAEDPFETYTSRLRELMAGNDLGQLETLAEEAIESYPSQPFFYYAHGYALNQSGRPGEAVEVLEAALDYLLDDDTLANKIYAELSAAYTSLGNTVKANMYLRKVKPGF